MTSQIEDPLFNIVLIEPEIPQNTGNIGRTCVGTGCALHLVGPMSFEITDSQLKRAGLDYWPHLRWYYHESYQIWLSQLPASARVFYFETKVKTSYFDVKYQRGDWLVFGKETKGLDPEIIQKNIETTVMIPQTGPVRSLNLATAVAISIYEGFRQVQHLSSVTKE
jgi:tRNA (cytidine/uridine-2'-O-)-methyltransferase